MRRLIGLYPRSWRDRYGDELTELIEEVRTDHSRANIAWDIFRGAITAHLTGRHGMRRFWSDPALRRGFYDGLLIAAFGAIIIVYSNVLAPPGANESDSDPEYRIQYLVLLAVLGTMFVAVGLRGRLRGTSPGAGVRAGVVAGVLLAVLVTLTFVAVNNIFLETVSQQHDKRLAFAASGWTSMRAYLTVTQLKSAVILVPLTALAGATAGLVGALLAPFWTRLRPRSH
jgi:hypothetical protein